MLMGSLMSELAGGRAALETENRRGLCNLMCGMRFAPETSHCENAKSGTGRAVDAIKG